MSIRNILTTLGAVVVAIAAYGLYSVQSGSSAEHIPQIVANGICSNDSDCGLTTRSCSYGPDKTCQNTCSGGSCTSCSPAACDTAPDTGHDDICTNDSDCGLTTRSCSYGPDKTCQNTCTNGDCRSCSPAACDTQPNPQTCQEQGLCGGNATTGCYTANYHCRNGNTYCAASDCPAQPPTCIPKTSCSSGAQCGSQSDGCGGWISCGTCSGHDICNTHTYQCESQNFCIMAEICGDGIDNDCNGRVDDGCNEPDPYVPQPVHGQCGSSFGSCRSGSAIGKNNTACGQLDTWTCKGKNGGSSASCSVSDRCPYVPPTPTPRPPVCGDSDYHIQPGASCNDGNPNTINDRYTSSCTCRGTIKPQPVCGDTDYHIQVGVSCNDNNPNTINDRYNSSCVCRGAIKPNPVCGDVDYHIQPGASCNDNNSKTINDRYTSSCTCRGTIKPQPVCGDSDYHIQIGASCNDNNPNTINDRYTGNCVCKGKRKPTLKPVDPCAHQGGDTDNDGVCNAIDNCVDQYNPGQLDRDGDGIGNDCDTVRLPQQYCQDQGGDADRDRVCDDYDNCPSVPNQYQENTYGDQRGDACEPAGPCDNGKLDIDNDGVCDYEDNCPTRSNPNQRDADRNGLGDVCDIVIQPPSYHPPYNQKINKCKDSDNDGVCDYKDNCPHTFGLVNNYGCPAMATQTHYPDSPCMDQGGDTDGDGICNHHDVCPNQYGTQGNNGCYGHVDLDLGRSPNSSSRNRSGSGGTTASGYECRAGSSPNGYGGCTDDDDPFWSNGGAQRYQNLKNNATTLGSNSISTIRTANRSGGYTGFGNLATDCGPGTSPNPYGGCTPSDYAGGW